MQALKLYAVFFQIGLFTFGGGYAMLPLLERECVNKYHWCTRDELLDIFAIGQCTPGVIAVNTATFLGRKQGGFLGAVAATLGVVSPSLIIICIIAALLQNFMDVPAVQHALTGIRVAVTALIFSMTIKLIKTNWKKPIDYIIGILAFLVVGIFGANPAIVVVVAGLTGLFYYGRFAGAQGKEAVATAAEEASSAESVSTEGAVTAPPAEAAEKATHNAPEREENVATITSTDSATSEDPSSVIPEEKPQKSASVTTAEAEEETKEKERDTHA